MQCGYLAEVKAYDGKCNCHREQAWTVEQCPEKEPPIFKTFNPDDSQMIDGSP